MAEDLQNISYLGNLDKRVVRNAKPGNKNNPDAGLFYIHTDDPYDDATPKEYRLQAGKTANFITVSSCTFVEGSKTVNTTSSFSTVSVGDFVRPQSTGGILYAVTEVNASSIKIDKPFELPNTTGICEVQKINFGRVQYSTLENEVGTTGAEFYYDKSKDTWESLPGSNPDGPFDTNSDGSITPMKDGISVHTLANDVVDVPDMSVAGVLDKYLPLISTDSNTVPFSPVPNPSNLTAPQDMSKFQVFMKLPTDVTQKLLVYTQDYLLSYTSSPMYDGYRPLSGEATNANIHLLNEFECSQDIASDYDGVVILKEGDSFVTNIYEDSLEGVKKVDGVETAIDHKTDFLTNVSTGATVTIGHASNEYPVDQVFGFLDAFPNGVSVKVAEVPLSEATESSFDGAPSLQEGVGYAVNDNNGGFLFLRQIPPDSCARIEYMVGGATQKEEYLLEKASDLRLNYFPIVPNTVKVSSYKGTRIRTLVEGEDFTLYYSNGIITLSEEVAANTDSITVQYSPATTMVCYVAPTDDNNTLFRYVRAAVQVDSNKTVKVLMSGTSLVFEKLVAHDGTDIGVANIKSLGNGVYSVGGVSSKMAEASYAYADLALTSDVLAYAPLIRIRKRLPRGSTFVDLEGIPSTDLEIATDSVLNFRSAADPSFKEYSWVDSVEDLDGVNSRVHLKNPLSAEVVFPLMYYTDAVVSFTSLPSATTLGTFGAGSDTLVFKNASDLNIKLGCLIALGSSQVLSVTGVGVDGTTKTVSVTPNTRVKSSDVVGAVLATAKPSYVEGDTGLLTEYPVVGFEAPVATLQDSSDQNTEIRFNIEIVTGMVKITRRQESLEDELIEVDTTGLETLNDVLEAIKTATSSEVTYTEIRDTSLIGASSLANTVMSVNPHQVPMDIKAYTTLSKKSGSGSYSVLTRGVAPGQGDYSVVGGVIALSYPIAKGDRFKVTYTHSDSLGMTDGDKVTITGSKFVGIPKDTSVRLVMDYLSPDQHMIQSMTELSFLGDYVYPYIEEQVKAQKGARSQGSQGISAAPSSGGGVYNNFMRLRDYWLSYNLLWKISEYYKYRMGNFSGESEALQGLRFGNNDFSTTDSELNRMSNLSDVEQQASLGESVFYPKNYRKNTPLEDGRYSSSYAAYDQVYVYNTGGNGKLYGPHSEFNSGFRDIKVGDTIKLQGWSEDFTVESIDSAVLVTLEEEVPDAPSALPSSIQEPGAFKGTSYSVVRDGRTWSYVDDRGCAGCVVVAPLQRDTFILTDGDKTFKMKMSEDSGKTWVDKTYTVDTGFPGIGFYSLSEMASLLYDQMYGDFIVRVEDVYNWPGMSAEVSKSLDISWPLPIPDMDGLDSRRSAIIIRSRKNNVWVKFPTTGGIDLGISKTKTYKSQYDQVNCSTMVTMEEDSRNVELAFLGEEVLSIPNKLERGYTGPMDALAPLVTDTISSTTDHLTGITMAYEAALVIMGETGMSPAYEQAEAASTEYQTFFGETQSILADDNLFKNVVVSSSVNKLVNDVTAVMSTRSSVNTILSSNLAASGQSFIEFTSPLGSSYDGRVLFGNKSNSPSVPIGVNYALTNVFPFYTNNSSYKGLFVSNPIGSWDSAPSTYGYSDGQSYIFRMSQSVTVSSTLPAASIRSDEYNLYLDEGNGTTHTIPYGNYPSLSSLAMAVNALAYFSMTLVHVDASATYGLMTPVSTPVSLVTPYTMYFGSRGDLSFYSISDYVLDMRVASLNNRSTDIVDYASFYHARGVQLENSFSGDGEALAGNRQLWLKNNLQRIWGPANQILPLKKMIEGV